MLPLDRFERWPSRLDDCARQYLSVFEYQEYQAIPSHDRLDQLQAILERPITRFTPVNEAFFRTRWAEVLGATHRREDLTLLEIASGDADMIPQMMARVHAHSRYITANMNRALTRRLREKTRDLPLKMVVIEDDAACIERHLPAESVDFIAFQHGVNDVLQAILCDQEGVDTIHTEWMDILPQMIRILQREIAQDTLELHAKPAYLSLLRGLSSVLRRDGLMVMNHYRFQLDLDWGYPPNLWENLIPITREWVKELPGCSEVFVEGFDPQWWAFYRKM